MSQKMQVRKSDMSFIRSAVRHNKIPEPMQPKSVDINWLKEQEDNPWWVFEQKHDGVRARIIEGRLYSRSGRDITEKFPEFKELEAIDIPLDGEIVSKTGKLADIAGRLHMNDEFKINLCAKKNPARFMVFDVPVPTLHMEKRKSILQEFMENEVIFVWMNCVEMRKLHGKDIESINTLIRENGWEGIVLKDLDGEYEGGKSKYWKKYKLREETVATFDMCEETKTGVVLEQSHTGRRVAVNGVRAKKVKKRYEEDGVVDAEIEYLELTEDNKWREPTFKRLAN